MKDIAIYGAGGFGLEVACLLNHINLDLTTNSTTKWNLIGFFDDGLAIGTKNRYGEVIGGINDLNNWQRPLSVVLALGSTEYLKKIAQKIINPQIVFPNLVAPDVKWYDYDYIEMGQGNIITFHCGISCDVTIGDFNILNANVWIGHNSKIGSFNILNPSVRISGGVSIGNENFFGVCSVVLQRKRIGNNITVATNSVIIKHTQDGFLYLGNPAKKMELI